ncbi:MAG: InlB B-repeat-containing protein [Treponemataceae bacterium]|nr:InlB B-repeat-containing protein [Treponemataceae bacterium]
MMHFTPKKAFGALAALLIFSVLITTVSCAAMFNKRAATGIAVILPTEKGPRFTRENAEDFATYFDITLYTVKDGKIEGEPVVEEKVSESTVISTLPGTYFVEVIASDESKDIVVGRGSSASNGAFWEEEDYEDGIFELKAGENVKAVVINMNVITNEEEPFFQLEFNPNKGIMHLESGIESESHTESPSYSKLRDTVLPQNVTREHYTFAGWTLNGKIVEQKDITTSLLYKGRADDGSITFIANWEPITHTVTCKNPDDTVIKKVTFTEADGYFLYAPENLPSKKYFDFGGWYSNPECKERFEGIPAGTTEDIVVYALWEPIEHNIIFEPNDGKFSTDVAESFFEYEGLTVLPTPTKDSVEFGGWYTDKSCTEKSKVTSVPVGTNSDLILYAKWNPIMHKVIYKDPDGSVLKEVSFEEAEGYSSLSEYVPSKDYFTFGGWYLDSVFKTQVSEGGIPAGTTRDIDVYAKWNFIQHSITLEGQSEIIFYEHQGYTEELPVPTQEGAEFDGWYTDKSFAAGSKVTSVPVGTNRDLILYAKWISTSNAGIEVKIDADIPQNKNYRIDTYGLPPEGYAVFDNWSLTNECYWYKNGVQVGGRREPTEIPFSELFEDKDVGVFTITCVFTADDGIEYSVSKTVTRE